jgi:hypothetical protein
MMKFKKKWSSLGGTMVEGANEPVRTTIGIEELIKGNRKVMPRETKNRAGQSKAGQQAKELSSRTSSRSKEEHEAKRPQKEKKVVY